MTVMREGGGGRGVSPEAGREGPLAGCGVVGFVAATDRQRARGFYEGVLGLRIASEEAFATVVEANGTEIRIVQIQSFTPAPYTVLGWEVAEIEQTTRLLMERGVEFQRYPGLEQDELRIWSSPGGARVAWFRDSEGNVLSLTEFARPQSS